MKASEVNLNRFLSQTDTQFIIPVYQRNYDWNTAQCKQLLDDILLVGDNEKRSSHFIGSIVYIHDDVYSASGIRELTVIDGQQRLTTITLMYISILLLAIEIGDENLVNRIQETYLINKFANEEEKLKLKPTENNDKALKFLLSPDKTIPFGEYSRLIDNYEYFKTRINPENIQVVLKGLNKLMFVEISLERDKDDPQRIFESLNSTGLELSQADLIRNYVLMGLKHKQQLKFYDNYWKHIESLAKIEELNISKVSDFIRDYLTMENKEIPNKNRVYLEFKDKYELLDVEKTETILLKIKTYSVYYNKLINPINEPDLDIRKKIKEINKLEVNVAYPFLMEIYNDYEKGIIDKQVFIEILDLIQTFAWRRFIVGLPTNALNKIFMRLYQDIKHDDYLNSLLKSIMKKKATQRMPNDREVIANLKDKDMYSIQSRNRFYFLERIENYDNREPVLIENNPDITIEHIFPQNPEPKWKLLLGEGEYEIMKEKYLNTIANLTLSGNNGKLSNKYFTEKRDMNIDGKEQGYKYSRLWLNKHISSLEKWDIEELDKRFEILVERFFKIWKYPLIEMDEEIETEEINIFDAEEPTHKKLEYFMFFDQKLELKTITDMYVHVIKFLFELQPQTFFKTDLCERLNISKEKDKLRAPILINSVYWMETNIDSRNKFERIKYALSLFEITDELFIKYSEN